MAEVPDTQENVQKCICGGCPSYDQCMREKDEILYCARERSNCEISKNGCLYYCEIGAEE
jgi:hypothetical protein